MQSQFPNTCIIGGSVITGDGRTFFERGTVHLCGERISRVREGQEEARPGSLAIDATGCAVIPGIVNAHAHGCSHGPSMPSGSLPFSASDVDYFRNRHLLAGTTTLLNVCGLALKDEAGDDGEHPLDTQLSTAHTPSNIEAAIAIDGRGLANRHKITSIEAMIAAGAMALGEAGGGQTLGGGAQDYRFIPAAIRDECGISIHPRQARALKEAVVGRALDGRGAMETASLQLLINESGLGDHFDAARMRALIETVVLPPVSKALQGLWEIGEHAARTGLPAIFHTALPTIETLLQIAESFPTACLIAGHANHPSFTAKETVEFASQLRARNVTIDVSTLDCIHTRWRNDPANLDALVEAGLVDTISTDFAGGDWDSILSAIQRMIHKGQLSAPAAVALATGNVAKVFPQLAGDRGRIEEGLRADLVICENHNLGRVRHVLVKGAIVVWNGALV